MEGINKFIESIAILGGIIFILYVLTFAILPVWFRRFSSDIAITALQSLAQTSFAYHSIYWVESFIL